MVSIPPAISQLKILLEILYLEKIEGVLNPDPENSQEITAVEEPLDIVTNPPPLEAVTVAIKAMKSGEQGDLDGITADMLKAEEVQ